MKVKSEKYKRRFVIGDVHGCKKTLVKLISSLNLSPDDDAVFFLGDYIDRGPDSSGVVDFILSLKNDNFNIFVLRGNHEQDFLDAARSYESDFFYEYAKRRLKSEDLLFLNGKIKPKYLNFFKNTVFYIELEDFFLVHAGFNFYSYNFLKDKNAMLVLRNWEFDIDRTNGKRIVHGHQPTYHYKIIEAVKNKHARIPLDNGCVYNKLHRYYDYKLLSRLCCLELNSFKLKCIKNIE